MTFPKNLIRNNTRRLNNRRRRAKNNKKGTSRRQGIVILIRSVACVYEKNEVALDDKERVVYYNEIFSVSSLDVAGLHKAADKPVGVLPQVEYCPSNITQARKKKGRIL